jgi:hypothetical protein
MNHIRLLSALLATSAMAGLTACNRPEVVTVPAPAPAPVVVPGPAGPPGPAGTPGYDGNKGEPGKNADGTTIIVVPQPASAPTN